MFQPPISWVPPRSLASPATVWEDDSDNSAEGPILVLSDLHGNLDLLLRALRHGARLAGRSDLTVVLIGDYCDNGPQIRELLDFLCDVKDHDWVFEGMLIRPILGNHDLACLLSASPGVFGNRAGDWWHRWHRYWNGWKNSTPASYGSRDDRAHFCERFPERHLALLEDLPWFEHIDNYVFVHAGLSVADPVEDQLAFLRQKDLSGLSSSGYENYRRNGGMPDQITHKGWARTNSEAWGCLLVTGHNKYPDRVDFIASHRLGLHSCACERCFNPRLPLHCALLRRGATDLMSPGGAPMQFKVH